MILAFQIQKLGVENVIASPIVGPTTISIPNKNFSFGFALGWIVEKPKTFEIKSPIKKNISFENILKYRLANDVCRNLT